jgi:hypothetical protein
MFMGWEAIPWRLKSFTRQAEKIETELSQYL